MNNNYTELSSDDINTQSLRTVTIGKYDFINPMLFFVLWLQMTLQFTMDFFSLDSEILNTSKSKLIACLLPSLWFITFKFFRNAIINFKYMDRTILKSEYDKALSLGSKKIAQIFNICETYSFVIWTLITIQYIPLEKSGCKEFGQNICQTVKIIAVVQLIMLIIIGIMFIIVIIALIRIFRQHNTLNFRNVIIPQTNTIIVDNIFTPTKVYDHECPICLESTDDTYNVLNCGHKYHQKCLDKFILHQQEHRLNTNCPICNTLINTRYTNCQNINNPIQSV